MSTNIDEMTKSLVDRQAEQIKSLTTAVDISKRHIFHCEQTILSLRKERNELYHADIQTIKLTSDFLAREHQYITTINALTRENHKLTAQQLRSEQALALTKGALANPKDEVKQSQTAQLTPDPHPIHLTPSYANIQRRERDMLHIEQFNYHPKNHQHHWQKR